LRFRASLRGGALLVGTNIPSFSIETPDSAEARKYLGLKEAKTFTVTDISAKLILVEFYSMYCPVCQRQAPRANKIFKIIKDDPALNKDVKFMGVGLGNKQKEIDIYKKTFRVKFPLFADADKAITKKTGIENIPLTILLDKNGKILDSHLGVVDDVEKYVKTIRTALKKQ